MSTPEKKSGGSIALIIVLALLVVFSAAGAAFMGWMYLQNTDALAKAKTEKEAAEKERRETEEQLISLQAQYDLLREIQNQSIDSVIQIKNAEIESLRMQNRIGAGGGGSAKLKAEVERLKAELAELRSQIEKLKKENADLIDAKFYISQELKKTLAENETLSQKNTQLSGKVEIASQIKISAIESYPVRVSKGGKEKITDRSKKANKIESCFTVFENDVVEKGNKTAYLVVYNPQGKLIGESDDKTFSAPGGKVFFTTSKEFYFDGKKQDMCMEFSEGLKDLSKGTYNISVYIETNKAAASSFDLR